MADQDKTRQQLIDELDELRRRIAALEHTETQRRQTEEELAKSKAILTAAIECLPFDFYALDAEGRCILQNAVSRRYFGDALGKTARQVCPDERALARWLEGNRRALAGEKLERETQLQLGGELRHFYSLVAPIRDDGELYGVLGVNVDITARKRAEEALRESECRYRVLAESTRDIIYIVDREGTLLYANQAASHCIGIPCAEIAGKRQADLFPPGMAQGHVEKIRRVLTTGEALVEDEFFSFGPEGVWLRVHLIPLRDEAGEVASVMGVCHNVTDRKRAEEALRKAHDELEERVKDRTAELAASNARLEREVQDRRSAEQELAVFKQFAEAAGRGFGMADLQGNITYVNQAMCDMLGETDPADVLGRHISVYYREDNRKRAEEEILPVVLSQGQWHGESSIRSRHGNFIPTLENAFLVRDETGQPVRLALTVADLSDRKRAEEALEREHRTLRHLLQSSDHERRTIAYEIHDGLAQYLAGAIMQFDSYAHLRGKNPEEAAQAFEAGRTMLRQGHSEARRLISGVRPPVLDESGVVEAIAHLVHEEARRSGRRIQYASNVNFDRLAHILENAIYRITQESLTNACKHSHSERVRVSLTEQASRVSIEIRDWGVGFDLKKTEEGSYGVEGIRQRVRLLGGKCSIQSKAGKGTRIRVRLPMVPREAGD